MPKKIGQDEVQTPGKRFRLDRKNQCAIALGIGLCISLGNLGFHIAQVESRPPAIAPATSLTPPPTRPPRPFALSQTAIGNSTLQGSQIFLNGKTINAPWIYQQQSAGGTTTPRISISDAGLMRAMGIQLLDTDNASEQPVQWFTAFSGTLPSRIVGGDRYLDLSEFAQQSGWQIATNPGALSGTGPGKLQISTPAAKVLAIRQGKQAWGDRIVIELDRPAPWQTDAQGQEFLLAIDAQISPALAQQLKITPSSTLPSLTAEANPAGQTRLRFGIPISARPSIWSVANPNRIVVDLRPDSVMDQNILWAPGLRWRQQIIPFGNSRLPVVWLEINPRQAGLTVSPILPNPATMTGTTPLIQTAQVAQVNAAINGGFFNRNRQLPLGAVRRGGRWLSGPILNRGAIAWDQTGKALFNRLTLRETIVTANQQRLPITHLNSGYSQAGIARYTTDWGAYTPLSDNEIIVTVQNNQVTGQQTLAKADTGSVPIPANGYLLAVRSNRAAAANLPVGAVLKIESLTEPAEFNSYPNMIGGGPLLVQNRQIVLNGKAEGFSDAFVNESAPRSAIGRTANGTLLLVAAHNRVDGSSLTLTDMAQLMLQLGAIDALNLDGGSSTTLYLGGQLLDRPSRTAARVHNGIGVTIK
jgi:Phosphodiester glycosidase